MKWKTQTKVIKKAADDKIPDFQEKGEENLIF